MVTREKMRRGTCVTVCAPAIRGILFTAFTDVHQTALVPASPGGATSTSFGARIAGSAWGSRHQPDPAGVRRCQAASVDLPSAAQDEVADDDEGQGDDTRPQGGAGAGQWPATQAA